MAEKLPVDSNPLETADRLGTRARSRDEAQVAAGVSPGLRFRMTQWQRETADLSPYSVLGGLGINQQEPSSLHVNRLFDSAEIGEVVKLLHDDLGNLRSSGDD